MKQSVEDRLISSIKTPEDLADISSSGITTNSFAIRRELFDFITKYNGKYGNIPSKEVLAAEFPEFSPVKENIIADEKKYLIDEVVKNDIRAKANGIMSKGIDLFNDDPLAGIDFIVSKLSAVKSPVKYSKSFTDKDAMKRLTDLYSKLEINKQGGITGIRTGLSIFDDKLLGWQPGNLISIVGRPTMGKSWLLLNTACHAYLDGKRVLFLSPEMSIQEVEARWDTLISALMGDAFPNDSLVLGKVNPDKYRKYLEKIIQRSDWITMDSNQGQPFTVQSIQSEVDKYNPDLLCIDGFLLLSGNAGLGDKNWESMLGLAYGIKTIAQSNKIVIITTAQASKKGVDDLGGKIPEMNQIYGGDALAQASDVVIMITADEEQEFARFISIPKRRNFKTQSKRMKIRFDVNQGVIGV